MADHLVNAKKSFIIALLARIFPLPDNGDFSTALPLADMKASISATLAATIL